MSIQNHLIEFSTEISKTGYASVSAIASTFYKINGESISYGIESYKNTRFNIRLEDFAYEHEKLDEKEKKSFYENIDHTKLNYLFEIFDKSRTTILDYHAKILSKLYANLIYNQDLNYFEQSILYNISSLNEIDLYKIQEVLTDSFNPKNEETKNSIPFSITHKFLINTISDYYTYEKAIHLGLIARPPGVMFNDSNESNNILQRDQEFFYLLFMQKNF